MKRRSILLIVCLLGLLVAGRPGLPGDGVRRGETGLPADFGSVVADSVDDALLSKAQSGDVDAFHQVLERSGLPPEDLDALATSMEVFTGPLPSTTGTPDEFARIWNDVVPAYDRSAMSPTPFAESCVQTPPTVTVTEAPSQPVECPDIVIIKGTAEGNDSNADFILTLDSSSSLVRTDPSDFRMVGSNALADALTANDRLAVIDFDAPEVCCSNKLTCGSCQGPSYYCETYPYHNLGTETEACFTDPVADESTLDLVLTDTEIARDFGMTSFNGAGLEILNAFNNCPSPITTYSCAAVGSGDPSCADKSGKYYDNDRIGNKMPLGGGARADCTTKVIFFTDGQNTFGCGDITSQTSDNIKAMDSDGVIVDLVLLGASSGSPGLEALVNDTGGIITTVTNANDLVDALLSSLTAKIVTIEAFNETMGNAALSVTTLPALPAVSVAFTVQADKYHMALGPNTIRIEATDSFGQKTIVKLDVTYVDADLPQLIGCPDPPTSTAECSSVPPAPNVTAVDTCDDDVTIIKAELVTPGSCPGQYTLARTWTAYDDAEHVVGCYQIVNVVDTHAPVLNGVPPPTTVECDAVPAPAGVTASDECQGSVPVTFSETRSDGSCPNNYTLARTWTAADDCGNKITATQQITVKDTKAPIFSGLPSVITVQCDAVPQAGTPTVTDNCDPAPAVTYAETRKEGDCDGNYTLFRTWTATDACSNRSTFTQTVNVVDSAPPSLVGVPADATIECGDPVPDPPVVTAQDNCDTDPQVAFEETRTTGSCPGEYTLTRTWTTVDWCSNAHSESQTIQVRDTKAPVIQDPPPDVTVECDNVPPGVTLTAIDVCDSSVPVMFAETKTPGVCPANYTLTRVWKAKDDCGNSAEKSQVVTVTDTKAPNLVGVPADVAVECPAVPQPPQVTAEDACDKSPVVTFAETRADGSCPDDYTLTRTWTATDNCGNTASASQTITVSDTAAPALSGVPADVAVECDAVPSVAAVTAADACDTAPRVDFEEKRTDGSCPGNYTLTRTWTAVDRCDNRSSASQTITVTDTKPPTWSGVPGDVTVECDKVPSPASPTASDNCDTSVAITFTETRQDGSCADTYTLTRMWTAVDNCSNSSSQSQVITVADTTPPVLSGVPVDIAVECDAVPPPAAVAASDNCDTSVAITFTETRQDGSCAYTYTLTRTWTAVDNCSNSSSQSQVITVADTTPPALSGVPGDIAVECDAVPPPATVAATDNCDAKPVVTLTEIRTDGPCPGTYIVTRTWTTTDACANSSTLSQVITVSDTKPPVFSSVPADVAVECDQVQEPAAVTATDNCDAAPVVVFAERRIDGSCPYAYTLERTWTATDNCGNAASVMQTVMVSDTEGPALVGVPPDETVECDAVPDPAAVTAVDNCDSGPILTFDENRTDGDCVSDYVLTRTWTATDICGNVTSATQVITVQDTLPPVLTNVPPDVTVECDKVPSPASPTASDNCDTSVAITFTEARQDGGCADTYTLTRTWTAVDNCSNSSSQSQVITVADTTPPVLSGVPVDIAVECDAVPPPAAVAASDNCDTSVAITFTEARQDGSCADTYTLTRTWTAVDNCSNSSSQSQVITVADTTPPVLSGVPVDIAVECHAVPPPATLTATDNCDTAVDITVTEVRTDGACPDAYTLTRTWRATDNCGNFTAGSQQIVVRDTIPPVLSGVPGDVTVECDAVPPPATPKTTDNCDAAVDVTFTEVRADGACPDAYTLTRTWRATDNCGNFAEGTQVVTVQDTLPPTFSNYPTTRIEANTDVGRCDAIITIQFDLEENCGLLSVRALITKPDTTSDIVDITPNTVREFTYSFPCGVSTVVLEATDQCGNTGSSQVIEVNVTDNEPPTLDRSRMGEITICGMKSKTMCPGCDCYSVTEMFRRAIKGNLLILEDNCPIDMNPLNPDDFVVTVVVHEVVPPPYRNGKVWASPQQPCTNKSSPVSWNGGDSVCVRYFSLDGAYMAYVSATVTITYRNCNGGLSTVSYSRRRPDYWPLFVPASCANCTARYGATLPIPPFVPCVICP